MTDQFRAQMMWGVESPNQKSSSPSTERNFTREQEQNRKMNFPLNYDIEKVLTVKSIVAVCYKQGNRQLILKRLPEKIVELQKFINVLRDSKSRHEIQFRDKETSTSISK